MATKPKTTEVTKVEENALVFSQEVPDYIKQDGNRGSEEVKSSDMVLPRLEIVQALSPIKDEVEGIKEGSLYNSVTQEQIGDIAYFIPVYYRTEYLIWKDRKKGGGFRGAFMSDAEARARLQELVTEGEDADDLEIVDTPVHYGMRIDPATGKTEQIVLSMAKTKAKVSRKWNSMIQIVGGDRFSRVYKISTFKDQNKEGDKFFNYVVQNAGFTPKAAYEAAEALYTVFKTQDVRAAHDTVDEGGSSSEVGRGEI